MSREPPRRGPPRGDRSLAAVPLVLALAFLGLTACGSGGGDGGYGEAGAADTAAGGAAAEAGEAGAADSAEIWRGRLMEALGGRDAWESTRYVRFDWVVARDDGALARSHSWDRYTGQYRLEFPQGDEDGRFLALFNVNELRRDSALGKVPDGRVWIGGRELEGAARDSALRRAYGTFINDSYWLLMPFKWADPGVHLSWEGRTTLEEIEGEESFPTVHLTFEEDLGVTTDQYWGYIDPGSHLMTAWKYHLEGREEEGAVIRWENWRQVGPIRLATDRVWPDGSRNIWFEELAASRTVPEGAFQPPGS